MAKRNWGELAERARRVADDEGCLDSGTIRELAEALDDARLSYEGALEDCASVATAFAKRCKDEADWESGYEYLVKNFPKQCAVVFGEEQERQNRDYYLRLIGDELGFSEAFVQEALLGRDGHIRTDHFCEAACNAISDLNRLSRVDGQNGSDR